MNHVEILDQLLREMDGISSRPIIRIRRKSINRGPARSTMSGVARPIRQPAGDPMTWDRIAHMNRAKARLPASGGKTYKRTVSRAPTPGLGTWERLTGLTTARWECATGDALAQYRFDVFGQSWEGL